MTQPNPIAAGLTPDQLNQLTTARQLGKKVRRATNVALTGGWVTAFFALVTLMGSAVSFSWIGLLLGLGMSAVSYFEFKGAGEIKRLDITALRRLAINQIAFAVMIIIYAGVSLYQNLTTPPEVLKQISADPELAKMIDLGSIQDLTRMIVIFVYVGVMLAALLGPGLTSIYYYTRTKYIKDYAEKTPQWILDLQRAGMSV